MENDFLNALPQKRIFAIQKYAFQFVRDTKSISALYSRINVCMLDEMCYVGALSLFVVEFFFRRSVISSG